MAIKTIMQNYIIQNCIIRNSDFNKWMLSMVAQWKGIDRNHGNAIVLSP